MFQWPQTGRWPPREPEENLGNFTLLYRQNHDPESKSKARRWVSAAALGEMENKHLKPKESPADKPLGNICWLYPKAEKTDDVSVKRPPKHSQQIPKESGQEIPASNLQRNKCK